MNTNTSKGRDVLAELRAKAVAVNPPSHAAVPPPAPAEEVVIAIPKASPVPREMALTEPAKKPVASDTEAPPAEAKPAVIAYLNCMPGAPHLQCSVLIAAAAADLGKDWRLIPHGEGRGHLAQAFRVHLQDAIAKGQRDFVLDTRSQEGGIVQSILEGEATLVIRGLA